MITVLLTGLAWADSCLDHVHAPEHHLAVEVGYRGDTVATETWTVVVDDPGACPDGVPAPPGLDGTTAGLATIRDGRLAIPPGQGGTWTFTRSAEHRGPWSGVLVSPIRTAQAELVVIAPIATPLAIWADADATLDVTRSRTRTATVSWTADDAHEAAWSTWGDWLQVATRHDGWLRTRLTSRWGLGAELTAHLDISSVDELWERVRDRIALDPARPEGWEAARPATTVLRAGSGSAAERGVVLLSLLRAAKHEARPGLAGDDPHDGVPRAFPAPDRLARPIVAVDRRDGTRWIDLARDDGVLTAPLAWTTGDLPTARTLPTAGPVGVVRVRATLALADDGSARIAATVTGDAPGMTALLDLLGPDPTERVRTWVTTARPVARELSASVERDGGTEVVVRGHVPAELAWIGAGYSSVVPALLGPAIAHDLSGVRVIEELVVSPPKGWDVLGVGVQEDLAPGLLRHAEDRKRDAVLVTDAWGNADEPAVDGGLRLTVVGPDLAVARKGLKRARLSDRRVIDAALLAPSDPDKAAAALDKEARKAFRRTLEAFARHAPLGDGPRAALWDVLAAAAPSDADRLRLVATLRAARQAPRALALARQLEASADDAVRVEATIAALALQGQQPPRHADAAVRQAWQPPLDTLRALPTLPAARVALASALLDAGELDEATEVVAALDAPALALELRVRRGEIPRREVGAALQALAGSDDAEVLAALRRAASAGGAHDLAVRLGLREGASRPDDWLRWERIAHTALLAGDLRAAAYAGSLASAVAGDVRDLHGRYHLLAALIDDQEGADLGARKAGFRVIDEWITGFDKVLEYTPAEHRYAYLRLHDDMAVRRAGALAERAAVSRERGLLDDLARDGLLRVVRHADAAGAADFLAGTVGQIWTSTAETSVAAYVRDPTARTARMELRLVGGGDPVADAQVLRADARASDVVRARYKPAALAAGLPGWPADAPTPSWSLARPWVGNRVLTGPAVAGFTDAERHLTALRLDADAALPPVLAALYGPGPLVARLDGGGELRRLTGGVLQPWVARRGPALGLGLTEVAALAALEDAERTP